MNERKELERAYRCIRGLYGAVARCTLPDAAILAYHALTIGAAVRFVEDGALDGSDYFEGKHVDVLRETLAKVQR